MLGKECKSFDSRVLGLLLNQRAEWKIQTENQHEEWKIWSMFVQPSFSIRQNRLNIEHK